MGDLPEGHEGWHGRFGFNGNDLGWRAIGVLAALSEPLADTEVPADKLMVWDRDDSRAFEDLAELEIGIRFIDPTEDVDGSEIGDLHRALGRFHAALPLSEAERHWLFDPLDAAEPERAWDIHWPETLIGVAEEVVSGGIKHVIQGRDVIRRLSDWRREQAEFAGQGTLDEARDALGEVALTLVAEENWPRWHMDMLADLRAGD